MTLTLGWRGMLLGLGVLGLGWLAIRESGRRAALSAAAAVRVDSLMHTGSLLDKTADSLAGVGAALDTAARQQRGQALRNYAGADSLGKVAGDQAQALVLWRNAYVACDSGAALSAAAARTCTERANLADARADSFAVALVAQRAVKSSRCGVSLTAGLTYIRPYTVVVAGYGCRL